MDIKLWGSDGKVSKPEAPTMPVLVDLGGSGFGFTDAGICHIVSQSDLDDLYTPPLGLISGS